MAINEDIIMNNTTTWTKTVYFTYDLLKKEEKKWWQGKAVGVVEAFLTM